MIFTKLTPDHYIYKINTIITSNDVIFQTENESKKTLLYWVHGDGLIPLHANPSLGDEFDYRRELKRKIFGSEVIRERLKPTNK